MSATHRFTPLARLLHWSMALMILAMLFIGTGMIAGEPERYSALVLMHKSVGIAIFTLALLRLLYRLWHPAPPLPADLPGWQRFAAKASQVLLYALMLGLPLVGWAMLSAGDYPVTLYGGLQLPPILPANLALYAGLRGLHAMLAWLLFAIFLLHLGAALFHGLIRRDGVLTSMASWRR